MRINIMKGGIAVTIALLIMYLCALQGTRDHGGPIFLTAIGFLIVSLCVAWELLSPPIRQGSIVVAIFGGMGRGVIVSLCAWFTIMLLIMVILDDPGDKFMIYAILGSKVPLLVGAIAGGIARYVCYRFVPIRKRDSI